MSDSNAPLLASSPVPSPIGGSANKTFTQAQGSSKKGARISTKGADVGSGPPSPNEDKPLPRHKRVSGRTRIKLYVSFFFMEVIMAISLLLAAVGFMSAVRLNCRGMALDSIDTVTMAYTKKVDQMSDVLMALEYGMYVQAFMSSSGASKETEVLNILRHIREGYEIEYLTIVDPDFKILASPNIRRVGEIFDPEGVSSAAKRANGAPVWTHGTLTYADLLLEGPPLYRDRFLDTDMALANGHPLETMGPSLIRYTAMGINKIIKTTVGNDTTVTIDDSTILGYIIAGDVINGKSSSTYLISDTLGGAGGVYERAQDCMTWRRASATMSLDVTTTKNCAKNVEHILAAGFDPNTDLTVSMEDITYLQDSYDLGAQRSGYVKGFALSTAQLLLIDTDSTAVQSQTKPSVLLTRAVPIQDTSENSLFSFTFACILILDACALFLATFLYLNPLDLMELKLKKGEIISERYIARLAKRQHFGIFVALLLLSGLGVAVYVRHRHIFNLHDNVRIRSQIEPGSQELAWRRDIDRVLLVTLLYQASSMVAYIQNPSDLAARATIVFALQRILDVESMEYATLVGRDGEIIVSANPESEKNHAGTYFNPGNILNATLETGNQYGITAVITWPELEKELPGLKIWSDVLFEQTTDSVLQCTNTHTDCLIRWVSSPIWSGGLDSKARGDDPDAVLILGDLVNGKTKIAETSNFIAGHGYSATYFYNTTGQYQMANGILKLEDGTLEADVEMPETAWLDPLRVDKEVLLRDPKTSLSTMQHIRGVKHILSARCVTQNVQLTSIGSQPYYFDYDTTPAGACRFYLIQSMPWDEVVGSILTPAYRWMDFFLSVCVIKLCMMAFICVAAYRPFQRIVLNLHKSMSHSSRKGGGSSAFTDTGFSGSISESLRESYGLGSFNSK